MVTYLPLCRAPTSPAASNENRHHPYIRGKRADVTPVWAYITLSHVGNIPSLGHPPEFLATIGMTSRKPASHRQYPLHTPALRAAPGTPGGPGTSSYDFKEPPRFGCIALYGVFVWEDVGGRKCVERKQAKYRSMRGGTGPSVGEFVTPSYIIISLSVRDDWAEAVGTAETSEHQFTGGVLFEALRCFREDPDASPMNLDVQPCSRQP